MGQGDQPQMFKEVPHHIEQQFMAQLGAMMDYCITHQVPVSVIDKMKKTALDQVILRLGSGNQETEGVQERQKELAAA